MQVMCRISNHIKNNELKTRAGKSVKNFDVLPSALLRLPSPGLVEQMWQQQAPGHAQVMSANIQDKRGKAGQSVVATAMGRGKPGIEQASHDGALPIRGALRATGDGIRRNRRIQPALAAVQRVIKRASEV